MSYPKVKAFLEAAGYGGRITVHAEKCDTVAHAAALIGCGEERIAKTMTFLAGDRPVAIVTAGDAKIDNARYKAFFHVKAKMVPFEKVEEIIGHEPGGVCPFAVNPAVAVYLDVSLRRFDEVHAAGGAMEVTVRVTPAELEKLTNAAWVDLSTGWCEEESQKQ